MSYNLNSDPCDADVGFGGALSQVWTRVLGHIMWRGSFPTQHVAWGTTTYHLLDVRVTSLTFIVSGKELEHRILSEAKAPPDTAFAARRDPIANMILQL